MDQNNIGNNMNEENIKTTPDQGSSMSQPQNTSGPKKEGSVGAVVGAIIVIIVIVLGGLYFLSNRTSDNREDSGPTGDEIRLQEDDATMKLETQSESDEVVDIEDDLGDTSLEDLDKELGNIDAELNF